jgi:hypothetical protein
MMAVNSGSDEDEMDLAMLAAASMVITVTANVESRRKPGSMCVRPMFQQRAQVGAYTTC